MKINVVVADDFPLWRAATVAALESDPAITVVGEAATGNEAVSRVEQQHPDVVLLDLHMPDGSGLSVLPLIRERSPKTKIIVLTASEKQEPFLAAMSGGANAYLNKRVGKVQLVQAIITVHGGGSVVTPRLANCLIRDYATTRNGGARPVLGERETEIVRLVALGMTDVEIGRSMYISPRTVQSHLAKIRDKLGVRRRAELARWAADHARV